MNTQAPLAAYETRGVGENTNKIESFVSLL